MRRISMFSVVVFLFGVLAFFALSYNGNKLSERIATLQGQNEVLKKDNESILTQIKSLQDSIEATNSKIANLNDRDELLEKDYKTIQQNIKNIYPKYEKANNYAANYNGDSIRRYFSDFK